MCTVCEADEAFAIFGARDTRFLESLATMVGDVPVPVLNERTATVAQEVIAQIALCAPPDCHLDHRIISDGVTPARRPVRVGKGIDIPPAYEALSEIPWSAPGREPNVVPMREADVSVYAGQWFGG